MRLKFVLLVSVFLVVCVASNLIYAQYGSRVGAYVEAPNVGIGAIGPPVITPNYPAKQVSSSYNNNNNNNNNNYNQQNSNSYGYSYNNQKSNAPLFYITIIEASQSAPGVLGLGGNQGLLGLGIAASQNGGGVAGLGSPSGLLNTGIGAAGGSGTNIASGGAQGVNEGIFGTGLLSSGPASGGNGQGNDAGLLDIQGLDLLSRSSKIDQANRKKNVKNNKNDRNNETDSKDHDDLADSDEIDETTSDPEANSELTRRSNIPQSTGRSSSSTSLLESLTEALNGNSASSSVDTSSQQSVQTGSGLYISTSEDNFAIISASLAQANWLMISVNGEQVYIITTDGKVQTGSWRSLDQSRKTFLNQQVTNFVQNTNGLMFNADDMDSTGATPSKDFTSKSSSSSSSSSPSSTSSNIRSGIVGSTNTRDDIRLNQKNGQYSEQRSAWCSRQYYFNTLASPLNNSLNGDIYYHDIFGGNLNIYSATVNTFCSPTSSIVYRDQYYFSFSYRNSRNTNIVRVFVLGTNIILIYNDGTVLAKPRTLLESTELNYVLRARSQVIQLVAMQNNQAQSNMANQGSIVNILGGLASVLGPVQSITGLDAGSLLSQTSSNGGGGLSLGNSAGSGSGDILGGGSNSDSGSINQGLLGIGGPTGLSQTGILGASGAGNSGLLGRSAKVEKKKQKKFEKEEQQEQELEKSRQLDDDETKEDETKEDESNEDESR